MTIDFTSKDLNRAIGHVIRAEMRLQGRTLQFMGAQIGVAYQQVGKYASGLNGLSVFRLLQFADVLGIGSQELIDRALILLAKEQAA